MTEKLSEVLQDRFSAYVKAFTDEDYEGIVGFFSIPALLIQPTGAVTFNQPQMIEAVMRQLHQSLPENYASTKLIDFEVFRFTGEVAAAHAKYDRLTGEGDILSSEEGFYYFAQEEGEWKICSVVLMKGLR